MKTFLVGIICAGLGLPAFAEEASMYADEKEFLADLDAMALRCAAMSVGQVDQEIFGITVTRAEDRCIIGEGEIDPMARALLENDQVPWAGLHGESSIWVEAR